MRMSENLKVAALAASILLGALAGHKVVGSGTTTVTECVPCAHSNVSQG